MRYAILVLPLALAACGKEDSPPANEPPREIALAPQPAAQPQLNDAPAKATEPAKAPARKSPESKPTRPPLQTQVSPQVPAATGAAAVPAPAPAAPAAAPMGTVSAGTAFAVRPAVKICTNTHKVGDRFVTTLNESVTGSNGATLPAGSTVTMRVVESARSEDSKDAIKLAFDVVSVKLGDESYEVIAHVTPPPVEKVRAQSTADQAKKVGAGAAIGAIAGQILGKNTKGTVTGAVVGAAAGAAVAAGTADYDGCIPQTANITVTLDRELRVKSGAKPSTPF